MKPYLTDPDFTLYVGDVRDVLAELPDESVHCVVTSPPYWGLRDYGTGEWEGGDADCDHLHKVGGTNASTLGEASGGHAISDEARVRSTTRSFVPYAGVCAKCGATRVDKQLGLEAIPEEYVAVMVEVFREVRRVLRADGTCWLNLGDTYHGGGGGNYGEGLSSKQGGQHLTNVRNRVELPGLKPKDLVGVPWKVAFALQADGWYLRADIIWAKPNPMPESVTDRPTKAHEYLFLLTKSSRYFYDADAIRERAVGPDRGPGVTRGVNGPHAEQARDRVRRTAALAPARRTPLIPNQTKEGVGSQGVGSDSFGQWSEDGGRNARSVWEIATQPYAEAHFATFPEELPRRCIAAGTSEHGVCPECGAPWTRIIEKAPVRGSYHDHSADLEGGMSQEKPNNLTGSDFYRDYVPPKTVGWQPSCEHLERVAAPATVLDPFMGSGTVALVARRLGRRSVGIELNQEYAELCARRLSQLSLLTPIAPHGTVSESPKEE